MHTGALVYALAKRTPSAAMRSIAGVSSQSLTQPRASQRCWSVMISSTFGRVRSCSRGARGAVRADFWAGFWAGFWADGAADFLAHGRFIA